MIHERPRRKYPVALDGQWITPIRRGYRLECCDCGLIHRLDFRLIVHSRGKRIQFRAHRTLERGPGLTPRGPTERIEQLARALAEMESERDAARQARNDIIASRRFLGIEPAEGPIVSMSEEQFSDLAQMLRALEWNEASGGTHCKVCRRWKADGHASDCALAALLAAPAPAGGA